MSCHVSKETKFIADQVYKDFICSMQNEGSSSFKTYQKFQIDSDEKSYTRLEHLDFISINASSINKSIQKRSDVINNFYNFLLTLKDRGNQCH
jgi:hypothetical protein